MNTPRFAELGRQSRAPSPAKASTRADATTAPENQTDNQDEPKTGKTPDDKKEKDMADQVDTNSTDYLAGQKAGESATKKAERDRANAVMASEHFVGREAMAGKLLAQDMSAESIIDVLAAAPTVAPKADDSKEAAEEEELSQGREMLDQMKQKGNADLGNKSSDDPSSSKKKAASVWARAREANSKI